MIMLLQAFPLPLPQCARITTCGGGGGVRSFARSTGHCSSKVDIRFSMETSNSRCRESGAKTGLLPPLATLSSSCHTSPTRTPMPFISHKGLSFAWKTCIWRCFQGKNCCNLTQERHGCSNGARSTSFCALCTSDKTFPPSPIVFHKDFSCWTDAEVTEHYADKSYNGPVHFSFFFRVRPTRRQGALISGDHPRLLSFVRFRVSGGETSAFSQRGCALQWVPAPLIHSKKTAATFRHNSSAYDDRIQRALRASACATAALGGKAAGLRDVGFKRILPFLPIESALCFATTGKKCQFFSFSFFSSSSFTGSISTSPCAARRVCIVGAGPAGFYCAKYLLQAAAKPATEGGGRHDVDTKHSTALQVADLRDVSVPLEVDMIEKLPAPYGLVRYGVAPDHPEIKRVTDDFDVVGQSPSFRYFGNVELGKDISLTELRVLYDAVVLAYGASEKKRDEAFAQEVRFLTNNSIQCHVLLLLNAGDKDVCKLLTYLRERQVRVEGKDTLRGCLSAGKFVGFYNTYPDIIPFVEKQLPSVAEEGHGLKPSVALIIGNGNVALDVARLLTKHRKKLQPTDVHQPALAWIARADIRLVIILGRRGWVQASFTNKELRELVMDNDLLPVVHPEEFESSLTEASKQELSVFMDDSIRVFTGQHAEKFYVSESRLKQRSQTLLEHMVKNWERRNDVKCPVIQLRFLASPIRTLPHPDDPSRLGAVEIARNTLVGEAFGQQAVRAQGQEVELIRSSLLIWSTGFRCVHPQTVEFPTGQDGAFRNTLGRIVPSSVSKEGHRLAGVYTSGWARRGPHGVIASNIMDAREVVTNVLKDFKELPDTAEGPRTSVEDLKKADTDGAEYDSSVRLSRRAELLQAALLPAPQKARSAETLITSESDERRLHDAAAKAPGSVGPQESFKAYSGLGASCGREDILLEKLSEIPSTENLSCCSLSYRESAGPVNKVTNKVCVQECSDLAMLLRKRGVHFITFDDWLYIKSVERANGQKEGKSAMKTATAEEMLRIAKERLMESTVTHASQNS